MEHRVPADTNSFGTQTASYHIDMEHRVPADTNSFGAQTAITSIWNTEYQLTLTVLGYRQLTQ